MESFGISELHYDRRSTPYYSVVQVLRRGR